MVIFLFLVQAWPSRHDLTRGRARWGLRLHWRTRGNGERREARVTTAGCHDTLRCSTRSRHSRGSSCGVEQITVRLERVALAG